MVICPVCGKINGEDARNCDVCGAPLLGAERANASPQQAQSAQSAAPFPAASTSSEPFSGPMCPVCRRPNRSASVFCAHCGHRLKQTSGAEAYALPHVGAAPPRPVGGPETTPPSIVVASDVTGNIPQGAILKKRYRVLRKVAQGGMGAVYETADAQGPAGNRYAVKEISPAALPPGERTQAVSDFRREAQMLASLHHPNLVGVVETFEEFGKHFLVMEFVPGRTLLNVLDAVGGPLPEDRVMAWARQLSDVIQYLHSQDQPVIYRDLKPANIMLVEGTERLKLIDFGIARLHKAGKSQDTEAFGTAGYAPPEQYGKGQTDQRSDIYALAATLHQLLTNRDPSMNPFNWLPIRQYNAKVSPRVANAIMEALNLAPEKRFQSIEAFAQALGVALPTATAPAPAPAVQAQAPTAPTPAVPATPPADAQPVSASPKAAPAPPRKKTQPAPATPPAKQTPPPFYIPQDTRQDPLQVPISSMPAFRPAASTATAQKSLEEELEALEKPPRPQRTNGHKAPTPAPSPAPTPAPDVVAPTESTAPPKNVPQKPVQEAKPTQAASKPAAPRSEPVEVELPARGGEAALVMSERLVDLGETNWNRKPMRRVQVQSPGGQRVEFTVLASQPWIAYNPTHFKGSAVTVEVKVRRRQLRFGQVDLHVPNLFAIIWARTRRVLPFIGCWFWLLFLVASSLGRPLLYGLGAALALLLVAEGLLWLWSKHVKFLVPAERLNTGRLLVKSTGGEGQIEVRVMARPSWLRRTAGWTMALVLLTAEVAVVAWLVLTLVGVPLSDLIAVL